MTSEMNLVERIKARKAHIAVIGLGYVGLPLAVAITETGFKVIGIETKGRRQKLAQEISGGRIEATSDYDKLADVDIVLIAVPTPLTKTYDPDLSHVLSATKEIGKHLRKNMLVILESTTYPGTTEEVLLPILSSNNLKVGKDFYLAFSPERIDPGNKKYQVKNIPKLVSGVTPQCLELVTLFYQQFIDKVVPISSTKAAEMTKILENVFRSVNVALVNELTLICDRMKIDVWEVVNAASTKPFGFMSFYPGPGLGGHCIPVDPFYLSWKAREYGLHTEFIELAGKVNQSMPYYVVEKISEALNSQGKCIKGSIVLILGVAYKKDIDDVRESPALRIIELLREREAKVCYHDPHVPQVNIDGETYKSSPLTAQTLKGSDLAVVVTDHSVIDYAQVVEQASLIVDTRNALADFKSKKILRI